MVTQVVGARLPARELTGRAVPFCQAQRLYCEVLTPVALGGRCRDGGQRRLVRVRCRRHGVSVDVHWRRRGHDSHNHGVATVGDNCVHLYHATFDRFGDGYLCHGDLRARPAAGATSLDAPTGITLVDVTNFLTVTVPADWADHDVRADRRDDGSPWATIRAAPNLQQFHQSGSAGMTLFALPATTDPAAVLTWFSYSDLCTDGGIRPFNDGRFVGQQQAWLDCIGEKLNLVNVAARPADNSFTMFLQVADANAARLFDVVASADTVPAAAYPTPVRSPSLTPISPVSPELWRVPSTPVANLVDDTGRLSMAVPSTWTDVESFTLMNDNANRSTVSPPRHRISRSTTPTGWCRAPMSLLSRSTATLPCSYGISDTSANAPTEAFSPSITAHSAG